MYDVICRSHNTKKYHALYGFAGKLRSGDIASFTCMCTYITIAFLGKNTPVVFDKITGTVYEPPARTRNDDYCVYANKTQDLISARKFAF